jgi:hypothetical protein
MKKREKKLKNSNANIRIIPSFPTGTPVAVIKE